METECLTGGKITIDRKNYLEFIKLGNSENSTSKINKKINKKSNYNLLVVGAGGIGCELIKILVTSGFKMITIVDMDNVEKSNLNRQFVYNQDCISKPKAHMIKQRIMELRKGDNELQISTYNENIKNKNIFNYSFFSKFDFIINALDNVDARLYVSDIAFLLQKPLINGGTEGLLGFVGVYYSLFKDSPCYNCTAKNKTQTIPVCSIKSKPHKIEHCIAWGKNLFEQIFCSINNEDLDLLEDNKNERSIFNLLNILLKKEPQKLLETLESKEELKITIIEIDSLKDESSNKNYVELSKFCIDYYCDYLKTYHSILTKKDFSFLELLKITIGSYYVIFSKMMNISIKEFKNRIEEFISCDENIMKNYKLESFNKDNKEEVDFVFAISNLRAYNFNIDQESRFKIHEIAGKIIPAIVTTNAIIAGVMVDEIVKLINEKENSVNEYDLIRNINKSKSTRNSNLNKQRKIVSVFSINDEKNYDCTSCSKRHPVLLVKSKFNIELKDIICRTVQNIQDKLNIENRTNFSGLSIYIGKNLIFDGEDIEDLEMDSNEANNLNKILSKVKIPLSIQNLEGKDLKIELEGNLFYIEFDKTDLDIPEDKLEFSFIDFYFCKENHLKEDINENSNNNKTFELTDFVNLENDDGIVNLDGDLLLVENSNENNNEKKVNKSSENSNGINGHNKVNNLNGNILHDDNLLGRKRDTI